METKYEHKLVEQGKDKKWKDNKYFSKHDVSKKPFTIILPPPNVTGKLHLGHAWDGFLQDTVIRYKKLDGFDVAWIPGMDHAGISTQAKVEQRLAKKNISRYDLGREKFLDHVWNWKDEYASTIRSQWSKLGLALDYDQERFTMDAGLSKAVSKVFIDLHKRGIIYRGERPINWDPKLQTVLSNIEVFNKETNQKMYYIKYQLSGSSKSVVIATVRTETLFSDVALAVNPKDERNKALIGKKVIHPLTNREMPIIADEEILIDKGSGIMKVSAHAEHDFYIIQANDLELKECIDIDGRMNSHAMEFSGMDRFEARHKIADKLGEMGMIDKVEDTISAVGISERSSEPIEVLVQPQWFVKMDGMANKVIKSLDKEEVAFHPKRFEGDLRRWMENAHDWCISRQLWWGHRIPAWYKNDEIKVQEKSPGEGWKQDDDVLDTWFSSGLAPFSFLGWPNSTNKLKRYYSTDLLVTGYDIIFFWVARMYFQSVDIMNKAPFKNVLIHGLIRDEQGRKMSKSLGNGIDPMDVIDKYGADSLRWFLLTNSTPGQDIRYSAEKIEAGWNLNNKLWNISRYIIEIMEDNNRELTDGDIWINNQLYHLKKNIDSKMSQYDFTIIGKYITKFIMDDFSSWYIEISKTNPNRKFALATLKKLLLIIHPFLPFISDHIFEIMGEELLANDDVNIELIKENNDLNKVIDITKLIREFRHSKEISNKDVINYDSTMDLKEEEIKIINKLANAKMLKNNDAIIPYGTEKIFIKLSADQLAKEQTRIDKKMSWLRNEIKRAEGILGNKRFIEKAPKEKVEVEKLKLAKFQSELDALKK